MITVVNFADERFKSKQKWSSWSAKKIGKVDKVLEYSPKDIDDSFVQQNKESVKYTEKGLGNYFWKPYVVNDAITKIDEGDYLFYSDSGTFFLKSVKPLIKHMEQYNKNIMCFKLPLIEKQWTKRDAFVLMDCDTEEYTNTQQTLATYFIVRKCKEAEDFLSDYKKYCSDSRILSDDANVMGKENYEGFKEHRHDQSVLSLLSKKNKNVLLVGDASDYGCFPYKYLHEDDYLFDKETVDKPKNSKFRGTLLSNRSVNPFNYLLRYYIKRLVINGFGIKV